MRALASSLKANGDVDQSVSHVISLVWKYVVVTIDNCMSFQDRKYTHLRKRFDLAVEEAVADRMERHEHDRLIYEHKKAEFEEKLAEMQKELDRKNNERLGLQDAIKMEQAKYEALRDPTGL